MMNYAQELMPGSTRKSETLNDAMQWGTMCEDHAVATYIHGISCTKFKKTGLWITRDKKGAPWLAVSPDGIVDDDTVVEIKCPYMGGNPFPYRKVPLLYIPQCQLEMYATNTEKCHFVCWTPRKTVIYLIKRDEKFLEDLLLQLKSFWNGAQAGKLPTWNMNLELLKQHAQKISDQSLLLKTLPSCRRENAMEHPSFNLFWKKNEVIPKRKCQGCGKLQVICKLHPCEKSSTCNTTCNSLSVFQSYTYGSGHIANSCYIDTFLEAIYHPFTRQITPATTNFEKTTSAMDTLLEAIVMREQGKFHLSKMALWSYLRHQTNNGQNIFPLGQMAAISNVFTALYSNMSQQEKNALSVTESLDIKCNKCHQGRSSMNTYSTYFLHNTNIKVTDIVESAYDPIRVAEKLIEQEDNLCSDRSICLRVDDNGSVCAGNLIQSSTMVNTPFLMAIELDKDESRPVQPRLRSKLQLDLGKRKYDLAAVIYHHNYHFWCEAFVSDKRYKEGWYLYNDMWNSGKAEHVGKQPQIKNPTYISTLLFERSHINTTTSCSKDHSTSIKRIITMAHGSNITPDAKQLKQNYLNILKSCALSIDETKSCKELKAQLLENEQHILDFFSTSTDMECENTGSVKRKSDQPENMSSSKKSKYI